MAPRLPARLHRCTDTRRLGAASRCTNAQVSSFDRIYLLEPGDGAVLLFGGELRRGPLPAYLPTCGSACRRPAKPSSNDTTSSAGSEGQAAPTEPPRSITSFPHPERPDLFWDPGNLPSCRSCNASGGRAIAVENQRTNHAATSRRDPVTQRADLRARRTTHPARAVPRPASRTAMVTPSP